MSRAGKPKVLVIGLDGATFDVLTPMMRRGLLPHLSQLMDEGVSGPLRSVVPPVSGPAWVSFMTGKDPGRHGIYDFYKFAPGRRGKRVISFHDIQSRSLWDVLTTHGKRVGAINVPITFPPYPVDGFMLTGMLTPPDAGSRQVHPPALYKELTDRFGAYATDVWWTSYRESEKPKILRDMIACMDRRQEISLYLMEEKPWDFFMTTITETDRLQHAFGNYLFGDPEADREPHAAEVRRLLDEFFSRMDHHLGALRKAAGPETSLFIVSDHGFGRTADFFLTNRWLASQGFLTVKEGTYLSNLVKDQIRSHPLVMKTGRVLDRLGVRKSPEQKEDRVSAECNTESETHLIQCVDWERTVAFMDLDDQQGIYINLRGREPHGSVPPEQYEPVRERVIAALQSVMHPRTGQPLLTYAKRREEVYSGPFMDLAPDIILCFNDFETYGVGVLGFGVFRRDLWAKPKWPWFSAHHRMDGVLIAHGTDIRHRQTSGARLVDIFPTILYALDVPIPDDLDGKILDGLFTDACLSRRSVQWSGTAEPFEGKGGDVLTEDAEKIMACLKGLGYF
ncbi:MAG: alkaline phosphatase family protein [Nitrospira sp.]|jgi:predicted AlkP superfamily phosphohydrolase/phosphomutase